MLASSLSVEAWPPIGGADAPVQLHIFGEGGLNWEVGSNRLWVKYEKIRYFLVEQFETHPA